MENEVIPCFYEAPQGELPVRWIKMMKASMKVAMETYCSLRMVGDYERMFYLPIIHRLETLFKDNSREACRLNRLENKLRSLWKEIVIGLPSQSSKGPFRTGEFFEVTVVVDIGELLPEELVVELYSGHMKSVDTLHGINTISMNMVESMGNGKFRYVCDVPCRLSGRFGFTVRVMPAGDDYMRTLPGLITWA